MSDSNAGTNMIQFRLEQPDGDRLRDEGLALVASNNPEWMQSAVSFAVDVLRKPGQVFICENVKSEVVAKMGRPRSENAWGSFTRILAQRGHLKYLGVTKMRSPRAHSRAGRYWEWV